MTTHLIGDSQAEGIALHLPTGWRAYAHRGYSTARLRDEVLPSVPIRAGDTVIFVTGGNDTPNAALSDVVRSTAQRIITKGAKLIWVGPVFAKVSPDRDVHPQVSEIMRRALSGKAGVAFIDAQAMTRDLANDSNVHLTSASYARYAQRLAAAVGRSSSGVLVFVALGAIAYFVKRRYF